MNFSEHNEDDFLINYSVADFCNNLLKLEKERKKILKAKFIHSSDKSSQLNKLAEIAYLNSFQEFSFETFHLSSELLQKPLEFYECLNFLKFLQVTDFEDLKDKISIELYALSEDEKDSFNDKLLKKLKTIEFSTSNISSKLSKEISLNLFDHKQQILINQSFIDALSGYIVFLLVNRHMVLMKSILNQFEDYSDVIFENIVINNIFQLNDFNQFLFSKYAKNMVQKKKD